VYKEILISVGLGMILFQLFLNYLQCHKKINIGLYFLPRKKIPLPKFDLNGVQLVFDIARKAQMLLTICADILEKWRSLFMWAKPEVTARYVLFVSFFFWLSVLTSLNTYCIVVGFLIVNKSFVMTYTYHRFPGLRYMFDIAFYFYRSLPTTPKKSTTKAHHVHPFITRKRAFPFRNLLNTTRTEPTDRRDTIPLTVDTRLIEQPILENPSPNYRRYSLDILPSRAQPDAQSITTTSTDESNNTDVDPFCDGMFQIS
jgi:hypothetical protein